MTTHPKKVRWAIIGTGFIANAFAEDMQLVSNAELVAVCSRSKQSAEAFAGAHHIKAAHDDYAAMLRDPDIDAIYVATPNTLHFEQTSVALVAGKAVLVEKPIVLKAEQVRQLKALADKHNTFLMEAMWTRFLPAIIAAREMIVDGKLGEIKRFEANLSFHNPEEPNSRFYAPELGGGSLYDLGIYCVSIAQYLLGEPNAASDLNATWRSASTGVDVAAEMELDYTDTKHDGLRAQLSCGFEGDGINYCVVEGSKASLVIAPLFIKATALLYSTKPNFTRHFAKDATGLVSKAYRKLLRMGIVPGVVNMDYSFENNGLQYQIKASSEIISAGKTEHPLMPISDSAFAISIIERVLARQAV